MENIKQIMDLFNNAEKWSAYIELSNYRVSLVEYLKSTLCQEIQALANYKLKNTGWIFEYDRSNFSLKIYPEAKIEDIIPQIRKKATQLQKIYKEENELQRYNIKEYLGDFID